MIGVKSIPLYKKIITELKSQIQSGEYKAGDMLPSENELCKHYLTTRVTIRHALSELANVGFIVRHSGKGSIVSEPKNGLGILSVRGVTGGIGNLKLKTKIITKPQKTIWPKDFFFSYSAREKMAGCIFFTRLRLLEDLPILYEETYISNINLSGFTKNKLEDKSLFTLLQDKYQIEIKRGEQKIWAIPATKEIGAFLSLKKGEPVVHLKRKLNTNNNNINVYSFVYCNTSEYYLQDSF